MSMFTELLKWLGPWTSDASVPADVARTKEPVDASGTFDAYVYRSERVAPSAMMIVCPGLHYLGPADPRLDRFLRILAHSGMLVVSPALPDFLALRVEESVITDLDRAISFALSLPDRPAVRPGLFSISFGSLPALHAARNRGKDIGGLMVFGGYADFAETIRFCLGGGATNRDRDPLNQPVVLMNLINELDVPADEQAPLLDAWRQYIESTWGRPEMKLKDAYPEVARQVAESLENEQTRRLFLVGCGVEPGALEMCSAALERNPPAEYLDPRSVLGDIRAPVYLCHGLDDDVIPSPQMDLLADRLSSAACVEKFLTGLYGHTGGSSVASLLLGPWLALKEGKTLLNMLSAMIEIASTPEARE